jgi:hypothetical protein
MGLRSLDEEHDLVLASNVRVGSGDKAGILRLDQRDLVT